MKSVLKLVTALLISLMVSLFAAAQQPVRIHCSVEPASNDTCVLTPEQYFIPEYEKSYSGIISHQACDIQFRITKPTVVHLVCEHQTVLFFAQPEDAMQLVIRHDSLRNGI